MSETRTLFINSKNRSSGNLNNFTIDTTGLTDTFWNIKEGEEIYVYPQSFAVMNDFDNINLYNRVMTYIIEDLSSQQELTYTFTLDDGVYTAFTLQQEIQDKFNASFSTHTLPITCEVEYNDDVVGYVFTFTSTTGTYFDNNELRFDFDTIETSPATLLGFDAGEYIPSTRGGNTQIILSSQAVNMVFQPSIQIHLSIVGNNYETDNGKTRATDMLFEINQGEKADFILYENPNEAYKTLSQPQFGSIDVRYTDNLNRAINFQSNSRLTLSFTKRQRQTDKNEKEMIKLLENLLDTNKLAILGEYLSKN